MGDAYTISKGLVKTCGGEGVSRCHSLPWVYETHDLTTSGSSSSNQLPRYGDSSSFRIHSVAPDQIVDGQLYRFFRRNPLML